MPPKPTKPGSSFWPPMRENIPAVTAKGWVSRGIARPSPSRFPKILDAVGCNVEVADPFEVVEAEKTLRRRRQTRQREKDSKAAGRKPWAAPSGGRET